jgi:quercetin dioxygenase-like cupin family protein
MRKSRVAGLMFLAAAALAQQQQSVEITSEPSHHLVLENEYVRVFDVTVAPKASTLVHRHNYDYLFVTLGDSDVISARPGEKPVALQLKDGDVRFTPGHFAHAAINNADRPFHNTTIELLKPSSGVKQCTEHCQIFESQEMPAPRMEHLLGSVQWNVRSITMPSPIRLFRGGSSSPTLLIAVSTLDLRVQGDASAKTTRRAGDIAWIAADTPYSVRNNGPQTARFVVLEFHPEPGAPSSGKVEEKLKP